MDKKNPKANRTKKYTHHKAPSQSAQIFTWHNSTVSDSGTVTSPPQISVHPSRMPSNTAYFRQMYSQIPTILTNDAQSMSDSVILFFSLISALLQQHQYSPSKRRRFSDTEISDNFVSAQNLCNTIRDFEVNTFSISPESRKRRNSSFESFPANDKMSLNSSKGNNNSSPNIIYSPNAINPTSSQQIFDNLNRSDYPASGEVFSVIPIDPSNIEDETNIVTVDNPTQLIPTNCITLNNSLTDMQVLTNSYINNSQNEFLINPDSPLQTISPEAILSSDSWSPEDSFSLGGNLSPNPFQDIQTSMVLDDPTTPSTPIDDNYRTTDQFVETISIQNQTKNFQNADNTIFTNLLTRTPSPTNTPSSTNTLSKSPNNTESNTKKQIEQTAPKTPKKNLITEFTVQTSPLKPNEINPKLYSEKKIPLTQTPVPTQQTTVYQNLNAEFNIILEEIINCKCLEDEEIDIINSPIQTEAQNTNESLQTPIGSPLPDPIKYDFYSGGQYTQKEFEEHYENIKTEFMNLKQKSNLRKEVIKQLLDKLKLVMNDFTAQQQEIRVLRELQPLSLMQNKNLNMELKVMRGVDAEVISGTILKPFPSVRISGNSELLDRIFNVEGEEYFIEASLSTSSRNVIGNGLSGDTLLPVSSTDVHFKNLKLVQQPGMKTPCEYCIKFSLKQKKNLVFKDVTVYGKVITTISHPFTCITQGQAAAKIPLPEITTVFQVKDSPTCIILGSNFTESATGITVSFGVVSVPGTLLNPNAISCLIPDFKGIRNTLVVVKVSNDGVRFSQNNFQFSMSP